MDSRAFFIVIGVYLAIWLFLFIASRLPPFSHHIIFLKKYWGLYVPFISWLCSVFPLVLPPIPLGPIAITMSWSRRRMYSFYSQGCEYLGKPEKKQGFPMGWLDNFFINFWDMATLGLAQLFATATLLKEMIQKDGTEAERAEENPLAWCVKWLLLGNVFFIATYIVCPGVIFAPLLVRLDQFLEARHFIPSSQAKPIPAGVPGKDASALDLNNYDLAVLPFMDNTRIQENIEALNNLLKLQERALMVPFLHRMENDARLPTVIKWKARDLLRSLESSQPTLPGIAAEAALAALLEKYSAGSIPLWFGQTRQYQVFTDGRLIELADQLPPALDALHTKAYSKTLSDKQLAKVLPDDFRSGQPVTEILERPDGKIALVNAQATVLVDRAYYQYIHSRYPGLTILTTKPNAMVIFIEQDVLRAILMPMQG